MNKKQFIIDKLTSCNKEGMGNLIQWMKEHNYFSAPASFCFHGNYEEGLIDHCIGLYQTFQDIELTIDSPMYDNIGKNELIISSFLHDLCKLGKDEVVEGKHALKSINIIKKFIELTKFEEKLIKFHMGFYGTTEFNEFLGEYSIKELSEAFRNNHVKLFRFCDDISANMKELNKEAKEIFSK